MKLFRLFLLAVALPFTPAHAGPPSTASVQVDTLCVLRVGRAEISHYALAKSLDRLAAPAATADERRRALEHQLARIVIIAKALDQHYDRRPEVLEVVDTMAATILTQDDGPLYAHLIPPPAPTEAEILAEFARSAPSSLSGTGPDAAVRARIAEVLARKQRESAIRALREQRLRAAGFAFDRSVAEQLLPRLGPHFNAEARLPEVALADAAASLASYSLDGHRCHLTALDWLRRHNRGFIRMRPRSLNDLEVSVRAMIVAELDLAEAQKRGLDRAPRFLEDRRNFLYLQALELFEKERLAPSIVITDGELESCYGEQAHRYRRTVAAWVRIHPSPPEAAGSPMVPSSEVRVAPDAPLAGAERLTTYVLRLAEGGFIGPIQTAFGNVRIEKLRNESEPVPFAEVAEHLRAQLLRGKLDLLIRENARSWAADLGVEDLLDPVQFGVTGTVERPWDRVPNP